MFVCVRCFGGFVGAWGPGPLPAGTCGRLELGPWSWCVGRFFWFFFDENSSFGGAATAATHAASLASSTHVVRADSALVAVQSALKKWLNVCLGNSNSTTEVFLGLLETEKGE